MQTHCGGQRGGCRAVAPLLILALQLRPMPASAQPADPRAESDALFYDGIARMAEGNVTEACAKFARSLALVRRGGTLLNLAICREKAGELAAALPFFEEALIVAGQDGHPDRAESARQHLDDLRPKLAWIALTPSPALGLAGLEITCDGAALPEARWGAPIAVDRGEHLLIATAPGRESFEARVTVSAAGETSRVAIPLLPERRPAAPIAIPVKAKATPSPPLPLPAGKEALGHGSQLGAVARVDVDPIHPGARVAVGATFGVFDYAELGFSALLGRDVGVEPQATLFLLGRGAWKPLINAGVPIFFTDGANAGVRGAAGVQWDASRHFGLFGQVGGAYFPGASPGVVRGVFLPSLGAQGRL